MARSLTIYRTTFLIDNVVDGEYGEDADTFEDSVDCEPDSFDLDEGITPVDLAVKALVDEGITAPSSMPGFHPGLWYSYLDGSYCSNYYTGEHTELSGHLKGFSEEEERQVHKGVMDAYAGIFGEQYRVA